MLAAHIIHYTIEVSEVLLHGKNADFVDLFRKNASKGGFETFESFLSLDQDRHFAYYFRIFSKKWTDQCEYCSQEKKGHCYSRALFLKRIKHRLKTAFFRLSIFSKTPYDSDEIFYSHSTPYNVLYVQGHQNRMTGIRASQKEEDTVRLFFRHCATFFRKDF